MSNRADRRRMMREETKRNRALIADYSKQQRIAGLIQNGITPEDLEKSFEEGRKIGFTDASEAILKAAYAGICLALNERFGFGKKRVYDALAAVDEKVVFALGQNELVDEVLRRFDITIDFGEAFDRLR